MFLASFAQYFSDSSVFFNLIVDLSFLLLYNTECSIVWSISKFISLMGKIILLLGIQMVSKFGSYDSDVISVLLQVFGERIYTFWGVILKTGIAGYRHGVFNFNRFCQRNFQMVYQITASSAKSESSSCLTSSSTLGIINLLIVAMLVGGEWCLPWWLMKLSIFQNRYWTFGYPFWKYLNILPIFFRQKRFSYSYPS